MDRTGQTLGKYELIRRLGKGGMAEVYLANQPTIERQVAIKVLHRHLAEDEGFLLRFKREARSLGQLQHPNIVNVIDFDNDDDVYFMVMDYIGGPTLRAYLDEKKILSDAEALSITAQLVEALAYAHQAGAVHRDIKPANVMFTDETYQQAVITDFGITKLVNDQTITLEGSMVGTPAYMSPEAVIGERVDGRADIYSVGVILYEMVTGRTPYEGATPLSLVVKQVHEPLPSPLEFKPDMSPALVLLIEKALSKEINGRYQTANEFLHAIQTTQNQLNLPISGSTMARATVPSLPSQPKPPDPPTVTKPPQEPTPAPAPESGGFQLTPPIIGGAITLLLLIVAAIFFLNRGQDAPVVDVEPTQPITAVVDDPTAEPDTPDPVDTPDEAVVVPEETAVPEPTALVESTAEPTAPPEETAVPEPTAEPTAEPTPEPELLLIEQDRTGTMHILANEDGDPNTLRLQVERVPLPPSEQAYVLWLLDDAGTPLPVGVVPFEDGRLALETAVDANILATFPGLLITLEETAAPPETPGTPIFSGNFDPAIRDLLQQLLLEDANGTVAATVAQTNLAKQHFGLAQQSLDGGDLAEAKRHMEHVVNILDGQDGTFFGDLNLDGQPQNPGDGVGVRVYLTQSRDLLTQIGSIEPMTAERQFILDETLTAVDATIEMLNRALQRAAAVTSTDTPEEAEPIMAEVTDLLNQLETFKQRTLNQTLLLVQIPVINQIANLPAPAPIFGIVPEQFGLLTFSGTEDGLVYRIQLAQVRPPEAGQRFVAWMLNSENDQVLPLAPLRFNQNRATAVGLLPPAALINVDQIIITLESDERDAPAGPILFSGQLDTPIATAITTVQSPDNDGEKGALFGVSDQLALAQQHFGLAQDALSGGNLAGAQVHTEHLINILDGRSGDTFGDLNGDGQAQNPGDDVGVRAYWETFLETLTTLEATTPDQQFVIDQLTTIAQNNLDEIAFTLNQASKVFASDSVEEAEPFMETVAEQLLVLENGRDLDDSTTIDPLFGEGGITQTRQFVIQLHQVPLLRVE